MYGGILWVRSGGQSGKAGGERGASASGEMR